ncbi:hypothetical protein GWK47_002270 [Chionoecetes opilio]|uniref:Uncharacterized protein n=1 Tax=Chionoecetes opilio TaxID=41210 RepID=A0A8J4XPR1_CHIOP|nr:hypothetical protein GWK47_002270 [Chionoecetes opilio]
MFQKGTKDQEKLPPSQKCLEQHIKRAHHQAQVWFQADVPIPEIESPIGSGWYEDATRRLHPHVSVDDPLPNEFTDILFTSCMVGVVERRRYWRGPSGATEVHLKPRVPSIVGFLKEEGQC